MKRERIQKIIMDLQGLREISTQEACRLYHSSEATIRRNFNELAKAGLAVRTHGGIRILEKQRVPSVPYGLRETWNADEKKLIAHEAAKFVQEHHTVMLYGGSTTEPLAYFLNAGRIITNFPELCRILRMRFPTGNGPQVILTGGQLNYRTGLLEGPALRRSLENYECDIGFSSSFGLDEHGLLDISDECSEQIALMLEKSALRIILADHTKFGRKSFCRCLPWEKIHILITTFAPENHATIKEIRAKGVKIVFAGSSPTENSPELPQEKAGCCDPPGGTSI